MFGLPVSASGDTIMVGALEDDCAMGINCGSAYVFRFNGTSWVEEFELKASDPATVDRFGNSVDIGMALPAGFPGNRYLEVVVGAPLAKDTRPGVTFRQGAIYVFDKDGGFWQETGRLEDDNLTAVSEMDSATSPFDR